MESFLKECETAELVRWVFCDMNGNARTKLIPGAMCAPFVRRGGRDLCAAVFSVSCSSFPPEVAWISDNGYPDCAVLPDPLTLHPVTWSRCSAKVLQAVCSARWADGSAVQFDPRCAAARQAERLRQLGLQLYSAFEPEWRLFVQEASGDFSWREESIDPYSSAIVHKYEQLLCDICDALRSAGVTVEAVHTEFGRGQMEITMTPKWGLRAADESFLYREIVKQVAANHGFIASFMSTPYHEESGSGLHFNHSLWTDDMTKNEFHDASQPDCMSQTMRHWVAGLAEHAPALTALTSPTVNCYRRLHKPFTPSFADWELRSRNATFRLKTGAAGSQGATYVENRLPSSAANPYLVFAATVAAGLDGIQRRLELPPPAQRNDATSLPPDMSTALRALADDAVMIDAMGPQLIEFYVAIKQQFDLHKVAACCPDDDEKQLRWERKYYLQWH